MEILTGIEIVDLGLWLKKEKILVVSDFHLGYEGMLEEKGMLLPKFQLKDILVRLGKILDRIEIKKVVINGDLKHEHGKILGQEWRDVLKLFDFLLARVKEVIVVKGNHDLFLGPVARKRGIRVVDSYLVGDVLIGHGDELVEKEAKIIVIGHEHPAISLKAEGKVEKYKCFLVGKWKKKKLIVLPSFNPVSYGVNVLEGKRFSPYLKDISKFKVYIVGEKEVFNFGELGKINSPD